MFCKFLETAAIIGITELGGVLALGKGIRDFVNSKDNRKTALVEVITGLALLSVGTINLVNNLSTGQTLLERKIDILNEELNNTDPSLEKMQGGLKMILISIACLSTGAIGLGCVALRVLRRGIYRNFYFSGMEENFAAFQVGRPANTVGVIFIP